MSLFAELKRRNVIRVAIAYSVLTWLVLQVADVLANSLELPPTLGKMVLAIMAIGFIPVLVFAWVYELTPEGIKREKDIPAETSITDHTAKRLNIAVIALLVTAIALFIADRISGPQPAPTTAQQSDLPSADADGRVSIAVLPFLNLSDDRSNEYFSDGLTETLLNMLAQVEELRVAARTSAFAFKGASSDIREIASQLDVSAVLEGSVQRAGGQVRVTAQLIDAASGSQIWSESFDRNIDDIFAIQDEIANSVVNALATSLLGEAAGIATTTLTGGPKIESLSTRSTEAYEFYLRGLAPRAESSHVSLPIAEQAFTEALLIDPNFREARIALTETYISMGDTAFITSSESVSRAQAAIKPLQDSGADDPLVAGLSTFIAYLDVRNRRFVEEEETRAFFDQLTMALARSPSEPVLYLAVAEVLSSIRERREEQLSFIERGLKVDPFNGELLVWKGRVLRNMDRVDEALATYARLREVSPENPNGYAMPGLIYRQLGQFAQAAAAAAESTTVDRRDHELPAFVAAALLDMKLYDEAEPWIARARLLDPDGGATQSVEVVHLHLTQQHDRALALAERLVRAQITNRRGAYYAAAAVYALQMVRRERVVEALELFETLAPGSISDAGYFPTDPYARQLVSVSKQLRQEPYSDEEKALWLDANSDRLDSFNPDWRESDGFVAARYSYLDLPFEEAAAARARTLADPDRFDVISRLSWRLPAAQPFVNHPEVAAAIERAELTISSEAEKYQSMVAAGEIPGI